MALTSYLVDKSALARVHQPQVRAVLAPLAQSGLLATCSIIEMELLFSATGTQHGQRIHQSQRDFVRLPLLDEVGDRAVEVQLKLIETASHRSVKLPDLLIAAIAERNGACVLHYDRDFDRIAEITGQETRWVVPAGTAD